MKLQDLQEAKYHKHRTRADASNLYYEASRKLDDWFLRHFGRIAEWDSGTDKDRGVEYVYLAVFTHDENLSEHEATLLGKRISKDLNLPYTRLEIAKGAGGPVIEFTLKTD